MNPLRAALEANMVVELVAKATELKVPVEEVAWDTLKVVPVACTTDKLAAEELGPNVGGN